MLVKRFHISHFESLDNNRQSVSISLPINEVSGYTKKVGGYSQEIYGYSLISLWIEFVLSGNTFEYTDNMTH